MPDPKTDALARLAQLADEVDDLDGKLTEKRAARNKLIHEAHGQLGDTVSITDLAAAARVRHSYASRCVNGAGDPQAGRHTS